MTFFFARADQGGQEMYPFKFYIRSLVQFPGGYLFHFWLVCSGPVWVFCSDAQGVLRGQAPD